MRLSLALLAGLVLLAPAGAEAAVVVHLHPQASVAGDQITLGDVASVTGDEPLAARLRAVRLLPTPLPGGTARLDVVPIRARLRALGVDLRAVGFAGAERVVVARAFQVVPAAALVAAVRRQVDDRLARRGETDRSSLALVPTAAPEDLRVPPGDVEIAARVQEGPAGSAFLSAAVTVSVDGREVVTMPLTFRAGRWQPVVVAAQALEPRRALGAADFRVERRSSVDLPPDALADVAGLADLELTRPVMAGEVITARTVRPRLLVKRGEIVTLVVEGQGFRATAQGQAKEDARRGDTVRVLNVTSRREVLGQVDGFGVVRVPFASARSER